MREVAYCFLIEREGLAGVSFVRYLVLISLHFLFEDFDPLLLLLPIRFIAIPPLLQRLSAVSQLLSGRQVVLTLRLSLQVLGLLLLLLDQLLML